MARTDDKAQPTKIPAKPNNKAKAGPAIPPSCEPMVPRSGTAAERQSNQLSTRGEWPAGRSFGRGRNA